MLNRLKRFVKLLVSLVWFAADLVRLVGRRVLGRPVEGTAVLLYYHGIRPEHRARFARQLDALLRWSRPIHADSGGSLGPGTRAAGITFDDGLLSFLETAWPELERRMIPSTVFVVADRLGSYPAWPGFIPDPTFRERMMTADQLRLLRPDLVTIGSHTLTHPTLTNVDEGVARHELYESRARLQKVLDRPIGLFSFPHGAHNAQLLAWCREAGYDRVFTIVPRMAFSDPHQFAIGRVAADPTDWPIEFFLKLFGAYRWLPMAFDLKRSVLSFGAVRRFTNARQNAA